MADHLHPQACSCGPCPSNNTTGLLLGDWRGLAVTSDGNLLVGGRWAAGRIVWVKENYTTPLPGEAGKGWFQRGGAAYDESKGGLKMGDGYNGGCSFGRPVWCMNREGDTVAISAVAETLPDATHPKGLLWFASGPYFYQPGNQACNTGDVDLGVASYDVAANQYTYYSPIADLGMAETNVRDMVALPDGRLVFAGPNSGIVFWDPKTRQRTVMRGGSGLPDDSVQRLELDRMVSPPVLHVSTNSGASSIRTVK
jgi:hypothetical protein